MGRISQVIWLALATLTAVHAQISINSPSANPPGLQSSFSSSSTPQFGAAITSGTNISSFNLYINGSFYSTEGISTNVTWTNTVTGVTYDLNPTSSSTTQLVVNVPNYIPDTSQSLFGDPVTSAQPIQITVTQTQFSESTFNASATFTLNPVLSAVPVPSSGNTSVLPAATVNQPYSTTVFTGGTGPYTWALPVPPSGSLPPGFTLPSGPTSSQSLSGTPTQAGLYQFGLSFTDEWGNVLNPNYALEVVATPVVSSVVPSSTSAGSNAVPITVTGTGFVAPTTGLNPNYPGSQIVVTGLFIGGSGPTTLATTVINSTTATATIPATYFYTAQSLGISVTQGNTTSNSVSFVVFPPAISAVSPSPITARPTAIPVTVTGSSFLASGFGSPSHSTILINNSPVSTTVNSSTSLSTSAVFSNPGTAVFQVENPGGSLSTAVNVQVLPAPTITSLAPNPFPGGTLTVNGTNFTNTMTVLFNGTAVPTTFVSATQLRAAIPNNLFTGTTAQVAVQTTDAYVTQPTALPLAPLQITTSSLPPATGLQPYDAVLALSGGTSPYRWVATGLPAGLTMNPSTGEITGTPTAFGSFPVGVTVTDANNLTATAQYTLTVSTPPAPTITAVSPSPITARATPVTLTITGTGFVANSAGTPSQSTVMINGTAVPTTVISATSLTATTTLSTPGVVNVVVENPGPVLSTAFPLTVLPAPTVTSVAPNPFPGGTLTVNGTNFTNTMTVLFNGVAVPTTFVSASQLRAAVPNNLFTGTTAQIAVQTTDAYVTQPVAITLSPLQITTTSLPQAAGLQPYDAVLSLSGGTSPYRWSQTGLPAGLTMNTSTGEITGTPTAFGAFTVRVTVTDANSLTATAQYTLTVNAPGAPTITSVSPSPITSRTTAVTLTITGVGFVANSPGTPSQSTVLIGGTAVPTTVNSTTSLSATTTLSTPGVVNVVVQNPGPVLSAAFPLTVLAAPTITAVSPSPFPGGTLTVTGTNFTATMVVQFNGVSLPTTFVSATQLTTGAVPQTLLSGTAAAITVVTTDSYVAGPFRVLLGAPLQITTTSLPPATGLQPYDAKLAATGGTTPITWTASGLPQGLSINSSTGEITGTPHSFGNFAVAVTVTDVNRLTATAQYTLAVSAPSAPPQITSGAPPAGFVNVSYNFTFSSSGGNGSVSFGNSGNLPPGLTLDPTGVLKGLPTTVGNYSFSVIVTDSEGFSSSASYTLQIKPQPLSITNPGSLGTFGLGSALNIKFSSIGGVPPYSYSAGSGLPPGATLSSDGTLSGTLTTPGTYTFTVTVSDSVATQPVGTKTFTIIVNPTTLAVSATFADGQVGVPYSAPIGATGGVPPYSFTVTGLPDGLSFANGSVTGTPTTGGPASVTVTVTDSAKVSASQTFTFKIAFPTLSVSTTSLPNGTVNSAYSGSLAATGGNGNYSWSVAGLPPGVTATSSGVISGTPTTVGSYSVTATVTDTTGTSASKAFTVTVAAPTLSVTTTSVANATAGSPYNATVAATGGVPAYTWSATGLPAGLTISSAGVISGTATAPGSSNVTVTVTDSAGTTASQSFTLTVSLPAPPTLSLTGLPANSTPATQSNLQIGLSTTYPVPVTVNLTLTFAADSGPDDPTVQFATGGRTAQLTIPAGSTVALTTIGVQTGTVAGTATITAQLLAGAQDITPTPAPTRTVRINSVPPVATTVTATSTSTGFTVTVTGYATARRITQAIFTFTPAAGVNLQTTTVTISVDTLFSAWYASSSAIQFGSQFIYSQPFTVSGGAASIASVTVTLVNADGSSTPVTVTVH